MLDRGKRQKIVSFTYVASKHALVICDFDVNKAYYSRILQNKEEFVWCFVRVRRATLFGSGKPSSWRFDLIT